VSEGHDEVVRRRMQFLNKHSENEIAQFLRAHVFIRISD